MKRLALVHPFESVQEFIVGTNCDAITRLRDGAYVVIRGEREDTIPGTFGIFTHIPRPGVTPEPTKEEPPAGIKRWTDGSWHCADCKFKSDTVHGVKTHRAMVHA
jgi:hypothetical protein